MKFRGAIFDLDGTLLDSMHVWNKLGSEYLHAKGIEPREDVDEAVRTLSLQEAARYFCFEYGIPESPETIVSEVNAMIAHFYKRQVQPKPGAREFLAQLQSAGLKSCVATATDKQLAAAALLRTGLQKYICGICTCETAGIGKDDPAVFDAALELLGTRREETIVFEDAPHAIKTAKCAGYSVCAVFDESAGKPETLRQTADYFIFDFAEAKTLFL